jgi:hypothetical protein
MAIKLTAAQRKEIERLEGVITAARDELQAMLEEIAETWQSEWDEKSERWQEGEAGEAAQERINAVEEAAGEIEGIEIDLSSIAD